jgi:NAD(P)-dependent dehydrogenase (short-subunit alcohol dehydrogenase family)
VSRRTIIVVGAAGLAAALAILADRGIAVTSSDDVQLADDKEHLAQLASALRGPRLDFPVVPEACVSRGMEWQSEPCPPFLNRAAYDHHAPRLNQRPSSYG